MWTLNIVPLKYTVLRTKERSTVYFVRHCSIFQLKNANSTTSCGRQDTIQIGHEFERTNTKLVAVCVIAGPVTVNTNENTS